jgi:hypothetical protein
MNAQKTRFHPVRVLDRLEGNKHLVMLYDNEKYADLIIARYCLNNLERGAVLAFSSPKTTPRRSKRD